MGGLRVPNLSSHPITLRGRAAAERIAWALLMVLLVAGCAGRGGGTSDVSVGLAVEPDPPQVGPATVRVTLRNSAGAPIGGATVELEGTMTHAGMVPVFADAAEVAPGEYEAHLEFTMAGDWILIVRAQLPDGRSLERQIEVPGVRTP